MRPGLSIIRRHTRRRTLQPFKLFSLTVLYGVLVHCAPSLPPSDLPPSKSDLQAIGQEALCQSKDEAQSTWLENDFQESSWGAGIKLYKHKTHPHDQHQWLIFNEDQILVGAITAYTKGLALGPYPELRRTLSQLPPAREFYFNSSQLLEGQDPDSAILYRTGEATTTHQYFLRKQKSQHDHLIMAVFILDPYERLLDGSHQQFLSYVDSGSPPDPSAVSSTDPPHDLTFLSLQQFARGEISLFASCGRKHPERALQAYHKALELGLPDTVHKAEAHHRLGLSLKSLGEYEKAQKALERALALQPYSASILNSYGTILTELKKIPEAIQTYEQALALKPNYAHARFNLAEAYELVNPKRALQEYETFLILVEGKHQELAKAQMAKQKIQMLQNR
jgi:tetratricopeptide (TPR) repeat protein